MAYTLAFLLISSTSWSVGSSNGFVPRPQGKVSPQEIHAIRTALNSPKAQCVYSNLGGPTFISWAMEWQPEIFDVPDPCISDKKEPQANRYKAMCVSSVMCRTPSVNFVVEKAICWSHDGKTCPPPSKCAQQSFLRSFQNVTAESVMPVYTTAEPGSIRKSERPRSTK